MDLCLVNIINNLDNNELILVFSTISGAVIGAMLGFSGTWILEKRRWKHEIEKEQRRACVQLEGSQYELYQAMENLISDRMDSSYWKAIWRIDSNRTFWDIKQEMNREYNQSTLEVSKSRAKFQKYISDIEFLFTDSRRIDELAKNIAVSMSIFHNIIEKIERDFNAIGEEYEVDKEKISKKEIYKKLDNNYKEFQKSEERSNGLKDLESSVQDLLDYLKSEIRESKIKIKADEAGAYYEETNR